MTVDQFGNFFMVVLVLGAFAFMVAKPAYALKYTLGVYAIALVPLGVWCHDGWNGLIAYNSFMNTLVVVILLARAAK